MKPFLLLWLAIAAAAAQRDSHARYPRAPLGVRDEADRDRSLSLFRDRLLQVVKSRDIDALTPLVAEELRPEAIPSFKRDTRSRSQDNLWNELARVLQLGGTFTEHRGAQVGRREFCAPYAYSAYPAVHELSDELLELTEGEPWVVIAKNVAVRAKPSSASKVVGRLSYELVQVQDWNRPDEAGSPTVFQFVQLPSGRHGFVADDALWGMDHSYHACFARINDVWQLTTFARGRQ